MEAQNSLPVEGNNFYASPLIPDWKNLIQPKFFGLDSKYEVSSKFVK
jgi:hypothetical protein